MKKRYIVLTAIITMCVTIILYNAVAMRYFGGFANADAVARAKNIIMADYVNSLTEEQKTGIEDAAISAMVEKLGDPYSRYMGEAAFDSYVEESTEDYVGIGMSVSFEVNENAIVVISPYDNSPSARAGVLPGDRIIAVDDTEVTVDNYVDVVAHIKDSAAGEGSTIHLKVLRGEAKEPMDIVVTREKVDVQTVSYKMYDDIGYIRIAEFINRTEEEFETALATLKDMDAKGVVIDLRNNPGGYAHTVISMCDMLLPEGIIAYLEDNDGKREYFKSDINELGLPMAILINSGTASASELLAGSVQAYGLATVIGETSFGKAVGQTPYMLTDKTALYLTNARYFTPKGECIDGKGITPDIEIKMSEEKLMRLGLLTPEEDEQLSKALSVLAENRQ